MSLQGRVAVVTGASSGIGAATAVALGRHGARVALLARRADRLRGVAADVEAAGGTADIVALDVRDSTRLTEAIDGIASGAGRLDIVVNNAGFGSWGTIVQTDPEDWRTEVDVNLLAPMVATRAAVPHLLASGGGHIVNVSSMATRGPTTAGAGYVASKSGLDIFSESTLVQLNRQGVKVTLVATGEVATEMQTDEDKASMKMLAAEDVADAILYALSRPSHVCVNSLQLFAPQTD